MMLRVTVYELRMYERGRYENIYVIYMRYICTLIRFMCDCGSAIRHGKAPENHRWVEAWYV